MKVYGLPLSFPANKVRMTANYLGLDYEFLSVDLMKGEHQSEEYLAKNPVGKIPVLDDDGFFLFESNTICRYLAQKANSPIFPVDLKDQAVVSQWIDFTSHHVANGIMKVVFNRVFAPVFGMPVDEQSLQDGIMFLNRFLPVVERQIAKHGNLAGEAFSLADILLLATIDPAEAGGIDLSPYPKLTAWRNALKKEPFYTACHTDFQDVLKAAFAAKK